MTRTRGTAHANGPIRRIPAAVVALAVLLLAPARAETPATSPDRDMARILEAKHAAVARADSRYARQVEAAETLYARSLAEARASWSGTVAKARLTAASDLKTLGKRMAAAGKVDQAIRLFKTVHALAPQDGEALAALTAAGVDPGTVRPEPDYETRRLSRRPGKVVIWNTHDGRHNTSGTLECSVVLLQTDKPVWRVDKVAVPWQRNTDTSVAVDVPARPFNRIRVEITKWQGYSGGLAEIEVWQAGRNIAAGKPARASAAADRRTMPAAVTDGITTSSAYKSGYWLLPDNRAGWVEVHLARPEYRQLVRARVSARTPWQGVLKVAAGDVIDITATGTWRAAPDILADADGGRTAGGNERGKFGERFYLQGRLGKEVFKIGSRFTLRAAVDGLLEMGMNEARPEWHANNSGFLGVTVTVRKRPAPPPVSAPPASPKRTAATAPTKSQARS